MYCLLGQKDVFFLGRRRKCDCLGMDVTLVGDNRIEYLHGNCRNSLNVDEYLQFE
jgi:hypothetical protein